MDKTTVKVSIMTVCSVLISMFGDLAYGTAGAIYGFAFTWIGFFMFWVWRHSG